MINRRDILIGGAGLIAAGSAAALTPRRRVSLIQGQKLETAIPLKFRGWANRETDAIVAPKNENDLASKLYSQVVGRLYEYEETGDQVMMLAAYGDTQNDLLQLHRPEVCYPAFGFNISESRKHPLTLAPALQLPARQLTAQSPGRLEQIAYWTRIGENLPTDGREQRWMKLKDQMAGIVPDGILVRLSNNLAEPDQAFALNQRFASDLIGALPAKARAAFIGTALAQQFGMRTA